MQRLDRLFDHLLTFFAVVASVLLVGMMLATVLKVAMRATLNHGILGIDQISGTLMVYITFLGAAWVLRKDGHVTVDIAIAALPDRGRAMVLVVASLVAAVACLAVAWYSASTVALSLRRGVVVAAELEIPRAVNLVVIPIGTFLLGIQFLRRALMFARGDVQASETVRMEA